MSIRVQHIRGTTAEIESVTPLAGEVGFDTTRKEAHLGDGATAGGMRLAKKNVVEILSPSQITANQNDYSPANLKHAGALNLTSDAARDITGLVPTTVTDTTDGRTLQIYNAGSFTITLKDQSASSVAANRFDLAGADVALAAKTSITLRYSNTAARWIRVGSTVGSSVADGAVIARTLAASALGLTMINGTIVESRAGGASTIAIKTLAGADPSASDPVLVKFRDASLATGGYVVRVLTAAVSIVISSGSSLGASNSAPFSVWLLGIDDGGTFRLGVVNTAGNHYQGLLTPDALVSSTAEGGAGAADNAGTVYTGVAVTSKPFVVLGRLDWSSGLAAAGTWNAAPSSIELTRPPLTASHLSASALGAFAGMVNGTLVESRAGNAVTFAIKTLAGNDPSPADPVYFLFRNATAGSGDYVSRPVMAALSLTISSGSTLGAANATPFRIWLVAVDTGTSVVLAAINCLYMPAGSIAIYPLAGFGVLSSTAEGGAGASDAAHVFYSAAAQSSKPYLTLGYASYESGLTTAGTWNTAPTRLQLYGPGVPLPGQVVQSRREDVAAMVTGATAIPLDNTIPQSTEGDQYMSIQVSPSSAVNLIAVRAHAQLSNSVSNDLTGALFRDSGANALAALWQSIPGNSLGLIWDLKTLVQAASVSLSTFKFRAGRASSGTVTFNGTGGVAIFGGVCNSFMEFEELMV